VAEATAPDGQTLVRVLSPATELADLWAQRLREVQPDEVAGDDVLLAVTESLIGHLADGDSTPVPEVSALAISTLSVLRQVGHERIASSSDPAAATAMLTRLDDAVDAMFLEGVNARIRDLELDALADPLTGAGNRRALERDLQMLLAQADRYQHALSIVMIDLDGLKAINDVEGHDAGDRQLRQLSSTFTNELRAGDAFYRVGGDEFVTVLPHADTAAAEAFVERVRPHAPPFSCGVATAPLDAVTVAELLDVADQRLIRHRRPGRGRRRADPPAPPVVDESRNGIVVVTVTTIIEAESTTVEVHLRQGGLERTGKSTGAASASAEPGIAASAALEAMRRLGYDIGTTVVESADVRPMAGRDVATVLISSRVGDSELLRTISSVVRRGVADAVVTGIVQNLTPTLPVRQVIQV
jgi:diguanylate cyclase (GGDEF)-like protein